MPPPRPAPPPPPQQTVAHFEGTPTAFLGALRGQELAAAYASADIFVMPSESETLGNVVGEVGAGAGTGAVPTAPLRSLQRKD